MYVFKVLFFYSLKLKKEKRSVISVVSWLASNEEKKGNGKKEIKFEQRVVATQFFVDLPALASQRTFDMFTLPGYRLSHN